jgi:hypothetical protein
MVGTPQTPNRGVTVITTVFPYNAEWEGHFYEQKEVTVYYKVIGGHVIPLTVKARYGKNLLL